MTKFTSIAIIALFLVATVFVGARGANAQTAVMPVLYSQSSVAVNTSVGTLPAGWYYLQTNGQRQVYYYGNGTYYDAASGTYGGSVSNPTGRAGVVLTYNQGGVITPGVPNTGAGGLATMNWAALILSGIVVIAGVTYFSYRGTKATAR